MALERIAHPQTPGQYAASFVALGAVTALALYAAGKISKSSIATYAAGLTPIMASLALRKITVDPRTRKIAELEGRVKSVLAEEMGSDETLGIMADKVETLNRQLKTLQEQPINASEQGRKLLTYCKELQAQVAKMGSHITALEAKINTPAEDDAQTNANKLLNEECDNLTTKLQEALDRISTLTNEAGHLKVALEAARDEAEDWKEKAHQLALSPKFTLPKTVREWAEKETQSLAAKLWRLRDLDANPAQKQELVGGVHRHFSNLQTVLNKMKSWLAAGLERTPEHTMSQQLIAECIKGWKEAMPGMEEDPDLRDHTGQLKGCLDELETALAATGPLIKVN